MKVQTLEQLIDAVEKNENFSHQIKGKRIKKQLKTLSESHFEDIEFKCFEISNVAICLNVAVKAEQKPDVLLVLRMDREYPFSPPQIFYHTQPHKSEYGYCKDLLGAILKNQMWGPSLTLPLFIQKLPSLAEHIRRVQTMEWSYHNSFQYGIKQLKQAGIKLYEVEEYKWEYKILKLKKVKVLGFTPDCMLKFQKTQHEDVLKLDFWTLIKNVAQVQAKTGKKSFSLQIDYNNNENKVQKIYLGGDPSYLQPILDNLNPIQMVERKVKNFQKSGITDYNDAIQCYSTLVEHYSLTNKELTEKYMTNMKKIIEQHFKEDEKKIEKLVQIKT